MTIADPEFRPLGASLAGEVIVPTDDGYDAARRVWNAIEPMGGAIARVPETATAFQHRSPAFSLLILAGWVDDADTAANVRWAREVWEATRPLSSTGVYVNYLGSEGADRVRDAFGVNHARLTEVKRTYDPDNLFRLNQNIEPGPADA